MSSLLDALNTLEQQARDEVTAVRAVDALQAVKVKFLGRKGLLTGILKQMGTLSPAERPDIGRRANELKVFLERELHKAEEQLVTLHITQQLASQIDVTLPGRGEQSGHRHPLTIVAEEIIAIFCGLGFSVYEGPEVETDYYNFAALNMPPNHPARDMQDTFYIDGVDRRQLLLRTHTSSVQIRVMEKMAPPIRMIAPGAVYRHDEADVTHSPMFHQVEGLYVDRGVTMGDLKGVLTEFAQRLFGDAVPIRFRPSFFPFTEPSAEVDIGCLFCRSNRHENRKGEGNGSTCRVCKGSGWLEILGAGMVDPEVFRQMKYDPRKVTGFAFGMGIERVAMLKYGINDIRLFYAGDLRFLAQF